MPIALAGNMEITLRVVDSFFDRSTVLKAVERTERQVLGKMGAYVRRRARSSIRRRKRISEPGEPPSAHAPGSKGPEAGLKFILFAYDAQRQSVVVGPVKLHQMHFLAGGRTVSIPQLLEFGGTAAIHEERWKGQTAWRPRDLRRSIHPRKEYRTRLAKYQARPFMRPALEKEEPKFAALWRDKVTPKGGGASSVMSLISAA